MSHTINCSDSFNQRFINLDRIGFVGIVIIKIGNLNMATKSNGFIANFVFKTNNYSYGNKHDSKPQCNTNGGYTNGRTRNIFLTLLKMNALSYEIF